MILTPFTTDLVHGVAELETTRRASSYTGCRRGYVISFLTRDPRGYTYEMAPGGWFPDDRQGSASAMVE